MKNRNSRQTKSSQTKSPKEKSNSDFDNLTYNSFDELEYSSYDEPMTIWQASEIDILMTKPTMLSDFEMNQIAYTGSLTYGEALELIKLLKDNVR